VIRKTKTYHGNFILRRGRSGCVKLQAFLDLLFQDFSKLGGWLLGKVVDPRSNRTLVSEKSRDSALVLRPGSADEGRVVEQPIFGRISLRLECPKQRFLGSEDLNSRGRVLGQIGQASGMRDQASTNDFADQSGQIGCHDAHLRDQVRMQGFAVVGKADNTLREGDDIFHISFRNLLTHTVLGSLDDTPSNAFVVFHQGCKVMQAFICQRFLVLNEKRHLRIAIVLRDNLDELGEVPRVPLSHPH